MRALPSMSPASRRHIAQLLHRMMAKAVFPCRLLATNPLPRGFLPKLGPAKAKACLCAGEDARLLASTAIPLCWRVLWGFQNREGPRSARRPACRCRTSTSSAARCASRRTSRTTPAPGRSLPACRRRCAPGSRSVAPRHPPRRSSSTRTAIASASSARPSVERAAERFRAHLQLAGIDRPELFEDSDERQQVRAHDTRSTFITVALANGRSEAWVADRTGHRSSIMIQRYRRASRTFAELGLGELASLADASPELGEKSAEWPAAGMMRSRSKP